MSAPAPLVEVDGLTKHFGGAGWLRRARRVRAVEDVAFGIPRGAVLGLVGESGSGKTTIGRMLVRLIEPTAGRIRFDGTDIAPLSGAALRALRPKLQYIFQDPFASLSGRMTVAEILTEGLDIQRIGDRRERLDRAEAALRAVEMPPEAMARYAHEFSGGQRQRIGIARALALEPEFIVADEPVSALDVSIQAQIVNLLRDLQAGGRLTMLLISHDLGVVEFLADHVVVLYLGRVMESGPSDAIYGGSRHPYTRALLAAAPSPGRRRRVRHAPLGGDIPSPLAPPSGCVFRTRCRNARAACAEAVPPLREVAPGHLTNCLYE
ncbi:MAG: ABC transporter ATP-binding protein [Alphaproteobacteria bacterium]|nr:ABC transporter ATP-binding protein [Alphaproteobacteria bacterium]